MIDSTSIQLREDLRASLARKMEDFERQHGAVVTQPIRMEGKIAPFIISTPDKPKPPAARKQSQAIRKTDTKMVARNAQRRSEAEVRLAVIRKMAGKGSKIKEMAEAVGIDPKSVMRLMRKHGVQRGPQTDLEA